MGWGKVAEDLKKNGFTTDDSPINGDPTGRRRPIASRAAASPINGDPTGRRRPIA